jgi:hypothetical protein
MSERIDKFCDTLKARPNDAEAHMNSLKGS